MKAKKNQESPRLAGEILNRRPISQLFLKRAVSFRHKSKAGTTSIYPTLSPQAERYIIDANN